MRYSVYAITFALGVWVSITGQAQRYNPGYNQDAPSPVPTIADKPPPADLPPTTSTVLRTNSMAALDEKKRLGPNDYVSLRVVEDRDNDSQRLRVNDNGELDVPYIGPVPAQGKSCKQMAYDIKAALDKEYYFHATVILALDRVSEKSRGRIYVTGAVRVPGPQEIPADETYTASKAVIRAGGFGDFAAGEKVKITRKGQTFTINVRNVIQKGKSEQDFVLQPDDQIFVPQRTVNVGF